MTMHAGGDREPTVAIVVPTYNRSQLLTQTLDSLLAQTRLPDAIVVIDDGSTDDTPARLQPYRGAVTCLRQANRGKSAALNRALSVVHADYVWVVDDDDLVVPDGLALHLAALRGASRADFTYGGYYAFEGLGRPPPLSKCRRREGPYMDAGDAFIRATECYPFNHESMLVPLHCYRQVGGFDETLARGQDYDMVLRLIRRYRGVKTARPTILIRLHEGMRGPAASRHSAAEREAVWRANDRALFRKLRADVPLAEFLPPALAPAFGMPAMRRRALLQRARAMVRGWLFEEALADMQAALAGSDAGRFSSDEVRLCRGILSPHTVVEAAETAFPEKAAALLALHAQPLLDAVAQSLARVALIRLREWRLRQAARIFQFLLRAVGAAGTALVVMAIAQRVVAGFAAGALSVHKSVHQ
ncbi:MAG TPA: glycosyltransferase [Gammaproteobacteria bacterium]|nr:glycosyltransferase [Gammaproteobacteria bacterium]